MGGLLPNTLDPLLYVGRATIDWKIRCEISSWHIRAKDNSVSFNEDEVKGHYSKFGPILRTDVQTVSGLEKVTLFLLYVYLLFINRLDSGTGLSPSMSHDLGEIREKLMPEVCIKQERKEELRIRGLPELRGRLEGRPRPSYPRYTAHLCSNCHVSWSIVFPGCFQDTWHP